MGIGITLGLHLTPEARWAIRSAERVLYLVPDPAAAAWIEGLNPAASSLEGRYAPGRPRQQTYRDIVEEVLGYVRKGLRVCLVLYGHPGVFAAPSHRAVRGARAEGFPATMLPGVSAEDCLFADLGVDPGEAGCQSYGATDYLLFPRRFDPTAALVLWQVGAIGPPVGTGTPNREGLRALAERLADAYGPDHPVVLYEASPYPTSGPVVHHTPLRDLPRAPLSGMATLYVPPAGVPAPDREMFARLGISPEEWPDRAPATLAGRGTA